MENTPDFTKPPVGLIPKKIRAEQRLEEIKAAIGRYVYSGYDIPTEWLTELYEIHTYLATNPKL